MLLETGHRWYWSNFATHWARLGRLVWGWCDECEDVFGSRTQSGGGVPDVFGDRFVAEDGGNVGREVGAVEDPDGLMGEKYVGIFEFR